MKHLLPILLLFGSISGFAQSDSAKQKTLDSVTITGYMNQISQHTLPAIQGTYVFGGKKTEVINLNYATASVSDKTARQVFGKVPGIFVYDMDGAGNQINISTRGLDPHRGWEFNNRKDGIITNSDMYGYPASHYSMPLESIERIELVRGTGSLQYGAQFGGMLNYHTKQGDTSRKFSFESINTVGSFNLLSTYNAIGGKIGKFRYYAYVQKKSRDGYRDNEHTDSESQSVRLAYDGAKFSAQLDWSRAAYTFRMAGQLTDQQFRDNPRQATRTRNYFNPDIHVPSITLTWQPARLTKLQLITSAVLGARNSVLFDKAANVRDTINATTRQYNNRQIDIDRFNSYTAELRLLQQYKLLNQYSTLVAGIQYMNNDLHRTQLGKGTTGSDFDLSLVEPGWGRDVHLKTKNIAAFAENIFQLTPQLSATAGVRVESGDTKLSGHIVYYPDNDLPVSIDRSFPLFGAGLSYRPKPNLEAYAGWSQAYHPMLFKDLIPASLLEKVDPNIKDADGYNAEIGFKGNWQFLRWDVTGFLLQFNNRFGSLSQTDANGGFYAYRTNIGNSLTKGLEIFVQADWVLKEKTVISVFTSTLLMNAEYKDAVVKSGNANINVDGNKVESAPDVITRNGISFRLHRFSVLALYSYTGATFADALNTVVPPPTTGAVGKVPAYGLLDAHASFRVNGNLEIKVSGNNLTDKQYFTKRPLFYPGPGVWPSDGINGNVTIAVRL